MSWSPGPLIAVRVVTEDGAADAHHTVSHLLRRMLQLVEPALATHRLRTLRQEDPEERLAAQPHRWSSRDSRDRLFVKKLARTIATDLLASRFVIVHADGDARWSDRPSRNETSFTNSLVPLVRAALGPERIQPRSPRRAASPDSTRSASEIERRLGGVILLMPYYTIEAWLYQNTEVAIRLCKERYRDRDIERFREWQKDRGRLDDETKERLAVCLEKKHNLDLASSGYPAAEVDAARASFHAAVEALRASAPLRAALSDQTTHS